MNWSRAFAVLAAVAGAVAHQVPGRWGIAAGAAAAGFAALAVDPARVWPRRARSGPPPDGVGAVPQRRRRVTSEETARIPVVASAWCKARGCRTKIAGKPPLPPFCERHTR